MKTIVVVDSDGFIRATAPASVQPTGKDAPRGARFVPGDGQVAHKLDVPVAIARLGAAELHRSYRVSLRGKPRLVKVDVAAPRPSQPAEEPKPASPAKQAAQAKKVRKTPKAKKE